MYLCVCLCVCVSVAEELDRVLGARASYHAVALVLNPFSDSLPLSTALRQRVAPLARVAVVHVRPVTYIDTWIY